MPTSSSRALARLALFTLCSLGVPACQKSARAPAPAPSGSGALAAPHTEVAARVGGEVITLAELEREILQMPKVSQAAFAEAGPKRRLLDRLVQNELLVQAAREAGLDEDPEVVRLVRQALVNAYLQREIDEKLTPADVPPADVDRYLKEHPEELARPEEVSVTLIVVKDQGKAREVLGKARAAGDSNSFKKLALEVSEDAASKLRGGTLPYFARDTTAQPRALVDAAFALKEPGDIAGPIAMDTGFAIIRLEAKRPGYERKLEEVRPRIEKRLREEVRARRVEELVTRLKKSSTISVDEKNLERVRPASGTPR